MSLSTLIANRKYPERYTLEGNTLTYKIGDYVGLQHDLTSTDPAEYEELLNQLEFSCNMGLREFGYPELLTDDELETLESEAWLETPDGTRQCVYRPHVKQQIADLNITATLEEKGRPVVVHFANHDLIIPEGTTRKEIAVLLEEGASK